MLTENTELTSPHANGPIGNPEQDAVEDAPVRDHGYIRFGKNFEESVEQILADTKALAHRKEVAVERLRESRGHMTEQYHTAMKEIDEKLSVLGFTEPTVHSDRTWQRGLEGQVVAVPDVPKRRGRKPGSKNKSKS